jgi:hypothetical protein
MTQRGGTSRQWRLLSPVLSARRTLVCPPFITSREPVPRFGRPEDPVQRHGRSFDGLSYAAGGSVRRGYRRRPGSPSTWYFCGVRPFRMDTALDFLRSQCPEGPVPTVADVGKFPETRGAPSGLRACQRGEAEYSPFLSSTMCLNVGDPTR